MWQVEENLTETERRHHQKWKYGKDGSRYSQGINNAKALGREEIRYPI